MNKFGNLSIPPQTEKHTDQRGIQVSKTECVVICIFYRGLVGFCGGKACLRRRTAYDTEFEGMDKKCKQQKKFAGGHQGITLTPSNHF